MAYLTRLGLWGSGTAFDTFQAFVERCGEPGPGTQRCLCPWRGRGARADLGRLCAPSRPAGPLLMPQP
jgi:hypothetical protein